MSRPSVTPSEQPRGSVKVTYRRADKVSVTASGGHQIEAIGRTGQRSDVSTPARHDVGVHRGGVQGPVGPQGPQGEVGPQGEQGPQGEVGPQGPMGGLQGIQGRLNAAGELPHHGSFTGEAWIVGPQGELWVWGVIPR